MALAAPADTEDRIRTVLASLVRERRELCRRGDRAALEANRIGIVYWQGELSKRTEEPASSVGRSQVRRKNCGDLS
jgi:hypothetical protein